MDEADWERRVEALWAAIDDHDEAAFRTAMERLVAERGPDDPVGLFELASAFDSTGHPEPAAEHYRAALDRGLGGDRRRRAVIQLASSLRNLGRVDESLALLEAERATGSGELDDELAAFLALALTSAGREREAVAVALTALAPHLTRYTRSVAAYAEDLA
jgi:tetratricopeptide (TPR) repeat protein